MEYIAIIVTFIIAFLLKPVLDELPTLLQIINSLFVRPVDLKRKYGSWAVVTGCTDGIGKAFSFELAKRGMNIVLIGRSISKLESVSSEIQKTHNVDTKIMVADFSLGREIYEKIEIELNGLDIGVLVNNVGVQYTYPMYFGEVPEDELWSVININVGAVTQMTRIVLPEMISRKRGAIVNIGSGSRHQPLPFMNLYAASKIYLDFFTEALRSEYRNSGITFQTLCPYYIKTKTNHFTNHLQKVNIFIPDADTYVRRALNTLGVIDNTTGYWPHRLQYFLVVNFTPMWLKTLIGGLMYKSFRKEYLSNRKMVS